MAVMRLLVSACMLSMAAPAVGFKCSQHCIHPGAEVAPLGVFGAVPECNAVCEADMHCVHCPATLPGYKCGWYCHSAAELAEETPMSMGTLLLGGAVGGVIGAVGVLAAFKLLRCRAAVQEPQLLG
mmetsp:Transcript_106714/g.188973  ORF Transcript_106714/g.188973 Transcript_106714/m.188973 type:complete len:126 (-) Transcript_106714:186-563(-)